jgi:16S rRNA (cytosine1402-N4)-methyltransferase
VTNKLHLPVLLEETIALLDLKKGQTVIDATFGRGGHAREILKVIGPKGRYLALDQDLTAIEHAQKDSVLLKTVFLYILTLSTSKPSLPNG